MVGSIAAAKGQTVGLIFVGGFALWLIWQMIGSKRDNDRWAREGPAILARRREFNSKLERAQFEGRMAKAPLASSPDYSSFVAQAFLDSFNPRAESTDPRDQRTQLFEYVSWAAAKADVSAEELARLAARASLLAFIAAATEGDPQPRGDVRTAVGRAAAFHEFVQRRAMHQDRLRSLWLQRQPFIRCFGDTETKEMCERLGLELGGEG